MAVSPPSVFVLGTSLYKLLTDYNLDIVRRLQNKDFNIILLLGHSA